MIPAFKLKVINQAIRLSARRDYLFFMSSLAQVKTVQAAILERIVAANAGSSLGKKLGFAAIRGVGDFQKQVPVTEYTDYLPYIAKQKLPGDRMLTEEKIILFEPTGGTSGGSKFIPYTRTLQREFRQGINTWLYDLYTRLPALLSGQSYWSITPAIDHKLHLDTTVPVGFASDAEYLGILGGIIAQAFAVPGQVKLCKDYTNFRYLTALCLLAAEQLTLVSVWNPTFLLLLLDFIKQHWADLVRDLYQGTCTFPCPPAACEKACIAPVISRIKSARRARALEQLTNQTTSGDLWTAVWPGLSLVSCWLDGESGSYAACLERLFPGVYIQAKGLLATEGIVSLPLVKAGGAVPAYTSHFFEFLPAGETIPCLVTDLEQDKCYQVILTTGGGLYRYNLKDCITVRGFYKGLPVIAFTGRNGVSDVTGEKLDFTHVKRTLESTLKQAAITPAFLLFAPEKENNTAWYTLFLEPAGVVPDREVLAQLADAIDRELKSNFHYRYARELGQLGLVEICILAKPGSGLEGYYRGCMEQGLRVGDIKPVTVSSRVGWKRYFAV